MLPPSTTRNTVVRFLYAQTSLKMLTWDDITTRRIDIVGYIGIRSTDNIKVVTVQMEGMCTSSWDGDFNGLIGLDEENLGKISSACSTPREPEYTLARMGGNP